MTVFTPATMRKFLDSSFSGRTTALTELLQNARRAGATRIDITYKDDDLIFVDNGCGIDNLETLLTPGVSGWDDSVMKSDDPFGLGFRAALLNCEHIAVSSKFGCFDCDTESLLNGAVPEVVAGDFDHTTITLHKPKIPKIREALRDSARFLPLVVTLNGERLCSPDEWVTLLDNEEYTLRLHPASTVNDDMVCTVQHLPVTMPNPQGGAVKPFDVRVENWRIRSASWALELKKAEARVPDRESLRNPEDFKPLDLTSTLTQYILDTDPNDTQRVEVCKRLAHLTDALMQTVNSHLGLYWEGRYRFSDYGRAELSCGDNYVIHATRWTTKGAADLKNLSVNYSGADESDMVAVTWLIDAEEGVDYVASSPYGYPVHHELELEWQVSGEIRHTLEHGRFTVNLCAGEISVWPQYVDPDLDVDDPNAVVYAFPHTSTAQVYDCENDTIWLGEGYSLYVIARQMERNLEEEYDNYRFDESAVDELCADLTASIELSQHGRDGLMALAGRGEQYLPSGVVRISEPMLRRCVPLSDQDGSPLKEGLSKMLKQWPQLEQMLRDILKEQDDAQK